MAGESTQVTVTADKRNTNPYPCPGEGGVGLDIEAHYLIRMEVATAIFENGILASYKRQGAAQSAK